MMLPFRIPSISAYEGQSLSVLPFLLFNPFITRYSVHLIPFRINGENGFANSVNKKTIDESETGFTVDPNPDSIIEYAPAGLIHLYDVLVDMLLGTSTWQPLIAPLTTLTW